MYTFITNITNYIYIIKLYSITIKRVHNLYSILRVFSLHVPTVCAILILNTLVTLKGQQMSCPFFFYTTCW